MIATFPIPMAEKRTNWFAVGPNGRLSLGQELVAGIGGMLLLLVCVIFSPLLFIVGQRKHAVERDSYRRKGRLVALNDVLKFADSDGGLLLVEFDSPGVFRRTWWIQSEKIEVLERSLPPVNKDQILDSIEQGFRPSGEPEYAEVLNSLSNSAQLVDVRPSFWTRKQKHKLPSARMIDEKFTRDFRV
jgi:hypothetical protein